MSKKIDIPPREIVISRCKRDGRENHTLAYSDEIFIKFGDHVTMAEASMQRYVHTHADPSVVRIPEVYDAFSTPDTYFDTTYIVMENIHGDDYVDYMKQHSDMDDILLKRIATAVRHIWEIPPPPTVSVGPFDQRVPRDRFFSKNRAGKAFNDVDELESWINSQLEEANYPDRVALNGETLSICHCDLTQYNIKVGEPVAILDWGYAGVYPRIFDEFALFHQFNRDGLKLAKALHKELFGEKLSKSMRPMSLAALYLDWGHRVPRYQKR